MLADRASLGDADGADRDLRSGRLEGEEALAAFVRGRIRRSQQRPEEARLEFQRAIEEATRRNQPDLATESRLLAGITAYESGDPAGASLWLDRYAAEPSNPHRDDACEALALSAYLAERRGDAAGPGPAPGRGPPAAAGAGRQRDRDPDRGHPPRLSAWKGSRKRISALSSARITSQPELLGVRSLLLARRAFQKPEGRAEAARLLRQSRLEGVDQTYFAEEAALLGSDLGEPPVHLWVDPPYPNLLRFAAVWELDRRRALASQSVRVVQP